MRICHNFFTHPRNIFFLTFQTDEKSDETEPIDEEEQLAEDDEEVKLPVPEFAVEDLHKLAPPGVTVVADRVPFSFPSFSHHSRKPPKKSFLISIH